MRDLVAMRDFVLMPSFQFKSRLIAKCPPQFVAPARAGPNPAASLVDGITRTRGGIGYVLTHYPESVTIDKLLRELEHVGA